MKLFDALIEEGTSDYLVLCYGVFPLDDFDLLHNRMRIRYPNIAFYKIHDDQWPHPILLSEVRVNRPKDVLPAALNLMSSSFDGDNCKAAVCMLDGAFYNYDMFSEVISDQIYAFSLRENEFVVALDDDVRSGDEWKMIISNQRVCVS